MSRRSAEIGLRHMLDHAHEAVALLKGKKRNDLTNTRILQLALVRLVEIIGEAAARVAKETRDKLPDIPWEDVVGMRNRLIHGYDMVDLNILWDTVTDDLPPLITSLEKFLRPQE